MRRHERIPLHDHSDLDTGGLVAQSTVVTMVNGGGWTSGGTTDGGTGSGITVQDEGTPLSTAATTLDFVGAGVTATGAGATKTITIPGGSGFDLGWFNVVDYGAAGDNATDDTTAIQDAIDACYAAGGGTVYFPPGIYLVSGAMQNTSTHNSQLTLPWVARSGPSYAIRFLGAGPNRIYGGAVADLDGEAVIRSDWSGTISGHPSIISAGTWRGSAGDWSFVYPVFEDLTIIAPDDPKLSALQMTAAASVRMDRVQIRTTTANLAGGSLPTHTNAAGYEGPWGYGSLALEDFTNIAITGYYTGLIPAEQTHGGTIAFAFCTRAMEFPGARVGALTFWQNYFTKVTIVSCPRGLVFTGDLRWVTIGLLGVEQDGGTWATVYDIDDASNYARGHIGYQAVDTGSPPVLVALRMNGGTGLSLYSAEAKLWKLNNVVEVPTGTDPSTNPATGFRLYAAAATGHPTVRDAAGTVTDLLAGGGTPATTVEDETTWGIAPDVGTDTEYARQDHTHGTPADPGTAAGAGELLVSDTPAGSPLVFSDILQNDAGTDLLYEG